MASFNEINGVPATANEFLLKHILRNEWGFTGMVVTDYDAIKELVNHGSAVDECDAAQQALQAGVDMDMESGAYYACLQKVCADGKIREQQITDSARRILEIKFRLGLFDAPYPYLDEQREKEVSAHPAAHLEAAYKMACESLVLLKNERSLLPLKPRTSIAVIGPLADSRRDLLGSWKADGTWDWIPSILDAVRTNDVDGRVTFAKGCEVASTDKSGFDKAVRAAEQSELVIMVLGESADMSGEAASRASIKLPGVQSELLRAIKKTGKPIVLVLMNGRPLALEEESAQVDALLEAWFPGTKGADAVADTLFGKQSPSGKLPVTFPRNLGQVPIYYSVKSTGRPFDLAKPNEKYKSKYLDSPNDPLYPFGFGLSYTTFSYSALSLDKNALRPGESLNAAITVSNSGKRDGSEIVQLYIHTSVSGLTRPILELKGFQNVKLKAGESRKIVFPIGEKQLAFLRPDMTWGTMPGGFEIFIGSSSRDLKAARFQFTD
jgi:beta-glucosidase